MVIKRPLLLNSIFHGIGFSIVLVGSVLLIGYNTFHTKDNHRFEAKSFLTPHTLISILAYRFNPGLSCNLQPEVALPAWLEDRTYQIIGQVANSSNLVITQSTPPTWTIYLLDQQQQSLIPLKKDILYQDTQLTQTYAPITDTIMYPQCDTNGCYIFKLNIYTQEQSSFPTFAAADKLPLNQINGFFFDESRQLASYKTNANSDSPRLVINPNLELIQTINESPQPHRQLTFIDYLPGPGLMRYHDSINRYDYFYTINNIGLYRKKCS